MTEFGRDGILKIYSHLMNEIKERLVALKHFSSKHLLEPDLKLYQLEAAYLQVRKISETFAMALAVAHNEYPEYRGAKILKEWQASKLVQKILKFNEHGFPKPVEFHEDSDPVGFSVKDSDLDPAYFHKIYAHCGDCLHVGTIKKAISGKPTILDAEKVVECYSAYSNLLNEHVIVLSHLDSLIFAELHVHDLGHPVKCIYAEAMVDG